MVFCGVIYISENAECSKTLCTTSLPCSHSFSQHSELRGNSLQRVLWGSCAQLCDSPHLIQQQSGMLRVSFCTSHRELPGTGLAGTPTGCDWSLLMSWRWQGWEQRGQVPVLGLQHQPLEAFPGSCSVSGEKSPPAPPWLLYQDQVKLSCEGLSLSLLRGSLENCCWLYPEFQHWGTPRVCLIEGFLESTVKGRRSMFHSDCVALCDRQNLTLKKTLNPRTSILPVFVSSLLFWLPCPLEF